MKKYYLLFVFGLSLFLMGSVQVFATTINFTGINVNGSSCTGGTTGLCSNFLNNNTMVGIGGADANANPLGPGAVVAGNTMNTTTWTLNNSITLSGVSAANVQSQLNGGQIINPGFSTTDLQAEYLCSVNGVLQNAITADLNSSGAWTTSNLPSNADSCSLSIIDKNSSSGNDPISGTPSAFQCRSGQCSQVTTDINGDPLAPGTQNTCSSSCATALSVSVTPTSGQMVLGTDPYVDYTIVFSHNGPANTLEIEIPCPSGAECQLFDSNNNQVLNFASGGYSVSGNYSSSNYTLGPGWSPGFMSLIMPGGPGSNVFAYRLRVRSATVGVYPIVPRIYVVQHPQVGCSGTCDTHGLANLNVVNSSGGACTPVSFVSGSVAPSPVAPGATFNISCNYGRQTPSLVTPANCTAPPVWNGNTAQYTCTAPTTPNTYNYSCGLVNVPASAGGDNLCVRTDPAGSLVVNQTAPVQCRDLITTSPSGGQCIGRTQTSLDLKWNLAGPLDKYEYEALRVSSNPADIYGACVSYDPTNCRSFTGAAKTTSSFTATGLTPATTYYNRLAAVCTNADGSVGFKDVTWSCTTDSNTPGVCLNNPAEPTVNGQSINSDVVFSSSSGNLRFDWGSVPNATSGYTLDLYDSNSSLPGTVIRSQSVPAGTTSYTFTNITPNSSIVRNRYTLSLRTNPTGTNPNCGSISLWTIWVRPPLTSCPASTPTILLSKTTIYDGDTASASAPAGYSCSNYQSSNSSVASVDSSGNITAGASNGSANISATCTYQGGPTCAVNANTITKSGNSLSANYGFNISPGTLWLSGKVGQVAEICGDITVTNTTTGGNSSNGVNISDTFIYGGSARSYDKKVNGSGAYFMVETDNNPRSGQICMSHDGLSAGSYTDKLPYAMYDNSGVELAPQKSVNINLTLTNSNPNYIASGTPTFTAIQYGTLPPAKTILVTNTGDTALNPTVSESISWAGVNLNSLSLPVGAGQSVNVSVNTTNIAPGTYTGTVDFNDALAGIKKVGVTYVVTGVGVQCTDPSSRPNNGKPVLTAPASVVAGSPFQVSCGAGSDQDNLRVTSSLGGAYECIWSSWSSTAGPGIFNCPAIPSPQTVTYTCNVVNGTSSDSFTQWCTLPPASDPASVTATSNSGSAACGSLATTYPQAATGWPAGSFCSTGVANPVNPGFPAEDATRNWTCTNSSNGTTANCSAFHTGAASPATVTVNASSCGTVSSSPSGINACTQATCQSTFVQGANVTLTATPSSRCLFTGWTGDCSGTGSCVFNNISAPKTVNAQFILKPLIYQEF